MSEERPMLPSRDPSRSVAGCPAPALAPATDPIPVPRPGDPRPAPPADLQALAAHIRRELRGRVVPGSAPTTYRIRLPGGRTLAGSAGVLLRLAERIAQAATGGPAPPAVRARVRAVPMPTVAYTVPAAATQPLPAGAPYHLPPAGDPTDPTAGPGSPWFLYLGCIWSPDAAAPDGWDATTAEVEIAAPCLAYAAVRLAVTEAVELADDELLAVRWAGTATPTCFLTAAQVRLAQHLLTTKEVR